MRKKLPLDYGGKKKHDYARRQRYRFSRRALLVGASQAGLFGLLGWRLHQLQILDSSEYRLLSDENRMMVQLVAPARGSIYDRFGTIIAENKENLRLLVLPAFCKNLPDTLKALSKIVPISTATRDRVRRAARRQSGYYPVLVAEGLTNGEIAEQLVISVKTVDRHRENIMRKLNLHSRIDLVKYAIKKGLIDLD